ncbi:MAG: MOMP family protein [Chlamydiia bacterium]|nr:MOMP family protein [Chlamydiia bacterium]
MFQNLGIAQVLLSFGYIFFFIFNIASLGALETNSSRIESLEKEIEGLKKDLRVLMVEKARPSANPGIMRDEWFVVFEPLYWYQRTNGTPFAYSNSTLISSVPLKGRTKDIDFGWSWGVRVGGGKNICFDQWDIYASFISYNNHSSGSAKGGLNSTLIPLRGLVITQTGVKYAKSTYDLDFYNIDLELGRHYYVSEKLSFRPFVGLKNAWIDQSQMIRYTGGSLGHNSAHIDDECEYWGIGLKGGINSKWHLAEGFYLAGVFSGALLYGYFDIEHREKVTPSPQDRIKLEDNKHRFVPMVNWRLGLGYGTYFNQKEYYLDIGAYCEGMYWWRQNQMLKIYEYVALRYDNFAEDLSMHGLTISLRLYF